MSADNSRIELFCHGCGARGAVGRVAANLRCRCGSTDLDLWQGTPEQNARVAQLRARTSMWGAETANIMSMGERRDKGELTSLNFSEWMTGKTAAQEPAAQEPIEFHFAKELGPNGKPYDDDDTTAYFDKGANNAENHAAAEAYVKKQNDYHRKIWDLPADAADHWVHQVLRLKGTKQSSKQALQQPKAQPVGGDLPGWNEYTGPRPSANSEQNGIGTPYRCPVCHGLGYDLQDGGVCRMCGGAKVITPNADEHEEVPAVARHDYPSTQTKVPFMGKRKTKAKVDKTGVLNDLVCTIEKSNPGLSHAAALELARRTLRYAGSR